MSAAAVWYAGRTALGTRASVDRRTRRPRAWLDAELGLRDAVQNLAAAGVGGENTSPVNHGGVTVGAEGWGANIVFRHVAVHINCVAVGMGIIITK